MEYYAGIDVSLKESSVCVVDAAGKVVREVKVVSEPEAIVGCFDHLDLPVSRIGLEAGPLSQWLHAALVAAGREASDLKSESLGFPLVRVCDSPFVEVDRQIWSLRP